MRKQEPGTTRFKLPHYWLERNDEGYKAHWVLTERNKNERVMARYFWWVESTLRVSQKLECVYSNARFKAKTKRVYRMEAFIKSFEAIHQ